MTNNTYHLAVVGNPIAHSLSPPIHHAFAEALGLSVDYKKLLAPLPTEDELGFANTVTQFFADGGHGLNITVPFKQLAFDMCDDLSERANSAQAVNTLYMRDDKLYGDNSDGAGLVNAIVDLAKNDTSWSLTDANIAIIGAGGASRGVILPLLHAGVSNITIANRTVSKAEGLVQDMCGAVEIANGKLWSSSIENLKGEFDIIINATSTSLQGGVLNLHESLKTTCAYDMVYKKDGTLTPFLSQMKKQDAKVADGFSMLTGQAAVSFALWTGQQPVMTDESLKSSLTAIVQK